MTIAMKYDTQLLSSSIALTSHKSTPPSFYPSHYRHRSMNRNIHSHPRYALPCSQHIIPDPNLGRTKSFHGASMVEHQKRTRTRQWHHKSINNTKVSYGAYKLTRSKKKKRNEKRLRPRMYDSYYCTEYLLGR
jgi:hypothetical protein